MPIFVILKKLRSGPKKYEAIVLYRGSKKRIKFGARGYQDFTKHKDKLRKQRYLARHKARENWGISGVKTAGFWARWLLWNKSSIAASKRDIMKRFYIRFINPKKR